MSTETVRFNEAGLDRWTEEKRFEVTAERIAEYARAERSGEAATYAFETTAQDAVVLRDGLAVVAG